MIKVWSPEHLANHARSLRLSLLEMGYEAEMAHDILKDDPSLYVMYCPQVSQLFPERYIAYNSEHFERFLTGPKNRHIFNGAVAIWSHTPETIEVFKRYYPELECSLVPPGFIHDRPQPIPWLERKYDVVFCGTMSDRRREIITMLRMYDINVNVVTNKFGRECLDEYNNSRILLNIHYEESSPLELFRIHEAMSCICHVVSERSPIDGFDGDYARNIHFINDRHKMIMWINYLLSNKIFPTFELSLLDNIPYIERAMKGITP